MKPHRPTIAVIVAAYRNWRELDLTLLGYRCQTRHPDEVIVAEDSEFPEVEAVVAGHAAAAPFVVRHVRHTDDGFRKCLILNRAIAAARSDFLIFTDADCIPRADLVANYARFMRRGRFLSGGGHINIPAEVHARCLTSELVESQTVFSRQFLASIGASAPWSRLLPSGPIARGFDMLSPRNAFVGNNSGAWRSDLIRVAGFDEVMGYGAEDRNIGVRLNNAGVRGQRARHSLVCLHLDHSRAWANPGVVNANRAWNRQLAGTAVVLPRRSIFLSDPRLGDAANDKSTIGLQLSK